MRLLVLALSGALLLSACGGEAEPPADEQAAGGTQPHDDERTSITGMLGADAQLEGGCAWVEIDGARYEVLWPEGYRVDFTTEPIALRGPDDAVVAEAGDVLTVEGAVEADTMSICQVGQIFRATTVVPD